MTEKLKLIKVRIEKIDKFHYMLQDKDGKMYHMNLEFYGLEEKVEEGDFLYIGEKYLIDNHVLYSFGPLDGIYGKEITEEEDEEVIVLIKNNQNIYLKRYYG